MLKKTIGIICLVALGFNSNAENVITETEIHKAQHLGIEFPAASKIDLKNLDTTKHCVYNQTVYPLESKLEMAGSVRVCRATPDGKNKLPDATWVKS